MTTTNKKRVAVLISGGGTNLQALIDACEAKSFPAEIVLVLSNKKDAFGLTRAAKAGIATKVFPHKDYASREAFEEAIHQALIEANVDIVCLAGFLRLFTGAFVERWTNKILNIHPSLLPSFKGLDVQQRAIDAGVKFSGCTVHLVRPEMDEGPIIIQAAVPVLQDDDAETLSARILASEHVIYPKALEWFASGMARVEGDKIVLREDAEPIKSAINPFV